MATIENKDTVKIKVGLDPLNPTDTIVHAGINGKFYEFEREEEVEVPRQVAVILRDAGYPVTSGF